MPHIYANDTWHLFYGYGYVVAQDRLFQMEMARRSTQGTVAEVLGKDFVKFDKDIRRTTSRMLSGRKLMPFPRGYVHSARLR
ncbi:penicillin acylase family protein [Escherichia coli]